MSIPSIPFLNIKVIIPTFFPSVERFQVVPYEPLILKFIYYKLKFHYIFFLKKDLKPLKLNMSLNQGRIYKLSLQNHSRLNSLYMVGYYLGGSLGSWISTSVYHSFGVIGITIASCTVLLLACIYYLITNKKSQDVPFAHIKKLLSQEKI